MFALPETSPVNAVMSGNGTVWVRGSEIPRIVREAKVPVACAVAEGAKLTGTWVRYVGPMPDRDYELTAPFTAVVDVAGSSLALDPRWASAEIDVRVGRDVEVPGTTDVERALGGGAAVDVRVRCEGERFVALSLTVP